MKTKNWSSIKGKIFYLITGIQITSDRYQNSYQDVLEPLTGGSYSFYKTVNTHTGNDLDSISPST